MQAPTHQRALRPPSAPPASAPPAPAPAPATAEAARAAGAAPRPASTSDTLDKITVTGSRVKRADQRDAYDDQPDEDQPPASADSPEVRKAWLQRIRELLEAGDRDAASDSLREFVRRHPQAGIPEDLRPLLDE